MLLIRNQAVSAGGRAFFRVHSNSVLCYRFSVNGQSWVFCCTRVERWIFDSLVLSPRTTGFVRLRLYGLRRDEIRSGFQNVKSAKIELCVISLFSLIKTFAGFMTGE
jgi:hypothetical protein